MADIITIQGQPQVWEVANNSIIRDRKNSQQVTGKQHIPKTGRGHGGQAANIRVIKGHATHVRTV